MGSPQKQQRQEKENFWRPHLNAWQKSSQTMAAYSREQGVNVDQFRYWYTQLYKQKSNASLSFTEMKVSPLALTAYSMPQQTIDIVLTTGHCVKVPVNVDEMSLTRLLRLLGVIK